MNAIASVLILIFMLGLEVFLLLLAPIVLVAAAIRALLMRVSVRFGVTR